MNTKDTILVVSVLCTGLAMGYILGQKSVQVVERTSTITTQATPQTVTPAQKTTPGGTAATGGARDKAGAVEARVVPKQPAKPVKTKTAEAAPTRQPMPLPDSAKALPAAVQKVLPNEPFALTGAPILGDLEKAKVAVIAFSDFQ